MSLLLLNDFEEHRTEVLFSRPRYDSNVIYVVCYITIALVRPFNDDGVRNFAEEKF